MFMNVKDDGGVMMQEVNLRSLPFLWDVYEDAPDYQKIAITISGPDKFYLFVVCF